MIAKPGEPLPGRAWLDRLARDLRRRCVRRGVSGPTLRAALRLLEATEMLDLPAPEVTAGDGGLIVELVMPDGRGVLLAWGDARPGVVRAMEYVGFGARASREKQYAGPIRVDRIRSRLDWLTRGARAAS